MPELLTLHLDGIERWKGRTEAMVARLSDLSPVWEQGDVAFRAEMDEQFQTEGAYLQGGVKWAPLSPKYARYKLRHYGDLGILVRSGRLWQSLAHPGIDHVKDISADSAVYGSTVEYGKYHQAGTAKMPQRKIIIVRNRLKQFFMRLILGYVVKGTVTDLGGADDSERGGGAYGG